MTCPACAGEMRSETFEGHYGRTVTIDVCPGCNGLWFDGMESHQLTPGATLTLFRRMAEAVSQASRPLVERKPCPRCGRKLTPELDRQRSTSFEAFRCATGHGRYMTFVSFLRLKNFVRDLTPAEVGELRRHIQQINCASCGASVDIRTQSACGYCRAPLAMLDPDQLQKTIAGLDALETRRKEAGLDPTLPLRLATERLRTEQVFAALASDRVAAPGLGSWSLVDAGITALAAALNAFGRRD
jgi:Zn-finger nucleic acid-binding protein